MRLARLSEIALDVRSGFASGQNSADGIVQFRMNNVTRDGGIDWTKLRRVPRPSSGRFELSPGDIMFNGTNSPELVGKTTLFRGFTEPVTFSNHFIRIRLNLDLAEPAYVSRWIQSRFAAGIFANMCRRWVNQASITRDQIAQLTIPLPPLSDQKRIATVLDQADDIRAKRRDMVERLEGITQALLVETFGDPAYNERKFPTQPLQDLVDPQRPITYGILKPGPPLEEGVRYVRVVDMKDGGIDTSSVRKTSIEIATMYRRSTLRAGDLLLSIRGHVGRVVTVPPELTQANITQDTARLAIKLALPLFVRECLLASGLQQWMQRHTKGGAVKGINLTDVKRIPIIMPPLASQSAFSEKVAEIEGLRAKQRAALAASEALFFSLQKNAFSGQLATSYQGDLVGAS
jgi:type I restriction enzyme S subunit